MLNHRSRSPVRGYVLAGILVFLSTSSSLAEPSDRLEQNKALVLESIAALDAGDLDNLDKFIADDYVRHCQATPGVIIASLDDFKALLREWEGTYSDVVTTVDVMIAEGDLVAFYGSYTAVQIGPMGPFPATGKQLVSEFAGYHRIADGKITETWVTWDNLAALVQLGLFPPPKEESSRSD